MLIGEPRANAALLFLAAGLGVQTYPRCLLTISIFHLFVCTLLFQLNLLELESNEPHRYGE